MTAEHFDRVLKELQTLQPFHIYTIELLNGRRFEVDSPLAMVIRDGVAVFLAPGGAPIWFDHEGVASIAGAPADPVG